MLVVASATNTVAAEMLLAEAQPLDLRAHRAVEDEDALTRGRPEGREDFGAVGFFTHRAEEAID